MNYANVIEMTHETLVVSDMLCPLREDNEIQIKQVYDNTVCCVVRGIDNNFVCPYFNGAGYPFVKILVDCKHKNRLQ